MIHAFNQILRTALDDSIQDAQVLLQDWLTMALYHYNDLSERGAYHSFSPTMSLYRVLMVSVQRRSM